MSWRTITKPEDETEFWADTGPMATGPEDDRETKEVLGNVLCRGAPPVGWEEEESERAAEEDTQWNCEFEDILRYLYCMYFLLILWW